MIQPKLSKALSRTFRYGQLPRMEDKKGNIAVLQVPGLAAGSKSNIGSEQPVSDRSDRECMHPVGLEVSIREHRIGMTLWIDIDARPWKEHVLELLIRRQ
jgi:hypothetical protein